MYQTRRFPLFPFAAISIALHLLVLVTLGLRLPLPQFQPAAPVIRAFVSTPGIVLPREGGTTPVVRASNPVGAKKKGAKLADQKNSLPRHTDSRNLVDALEAPTPEQRPIEAAPQQGESADANRLAANSTQPRDGISADGLRQYRLALGREARRLKVYPRLARERGWQGTTEVTIAAGGLGEYPSVKVTSSSGYPLLDDQAVAMVTEAVRRVPFPDGLSGPGFKTVIPVRFALED